MNPPYDRNLHLKFLEKVIKVADKTVNISPVRWLQDPLARYKKNSDYNRYKVSIADKIENLYIIDRFKSSDLFSCAVLNTDLGIYVCTENGSDNEWLIENKLYELLVDKVGTGIPVQKLCDQKYPYFVLVKQIDGGRGGKIGGKGNAIFVRDSSYYGKYCINDSKDYICSNGKTLEQAKRDGHAVAGKIPEWWTVGFNTANEAVNFYNMTETAFFRYMYLTSMVDVNVHPQFLPWMGDYTEPWTNARFCEYFGITGFVSDTEAEPGSEWETILETMKKYA